MRGNWELGNYLKVLAFIAFCALFVVTLYVFVYLLPQVHR